MDPERDWPDEKWWAPYTDPQLDILIGEALVHTPSMTIAEARFRQAIATAKQAGAISGIQKKPELFMERNRHGLENLTSIERAKSFLARTKEEVLSLKKRIGLQGNKLVARMGANPDRVLLITRPQLYPAANYALPAELSLNLLGRRPDIVTARCKSRPRPA